MIKKNNHYEQLIETLIQRNALSQNDLNKIQRVQLSNPDDSLPVLLHKLGLCSETDMAEAFATLTGLEIARTADFPEISPLPESIPARFLKNHHVVGISATDNAVTIALFDPLDPFTNEAVAFACGKPIICKIGLFSEIDSALDQQSGHSKSKMDMIVDSLGTEESSDNDDLDYLRDLASEAPIIKMVNYIMQKAVENRASDIHIEPFEQKLHVRLRIDGVLQDIESPPVSSSAAVISRIKIMAKLNIAERRLPQDGRIKLQMSGKELDLRVSCIPTLHGESIVIRLLDKENAVLDFEKLGFAGTQAERFISTLDKPNGIILITGPTGSGKSTTLYTALKRLHTPERKIITVEDPIEYQLEGVNQIQAKPQIGLTFASALRSIVRQDPDIIMIGEMRDLETAKIAVQSALTGHLVLSTLHTNDAASGVTRLLDMGIEEYLLSSTVNGILAQRLVRVLCPHCKQQQEIDAEVFRELGYRLPDTQTTIRVWRPQGCQACSGLGYRGRIAIMEFFAMTPTIRKLIMQQEDSNKIQAQAIQEGMKTMFEDGLDKVLLGSTTIDEVLRVTTQH